MNRPESLSKSYFRRSLSVGLAASMLLVLALVGVDTSKGGVDDSIRPLVQTHIRDGKAQLANHAYAEAEKTFLMAQSYQEYLSPTDQSELLELIKQARVGSLKRKRVVESLRAANELIKQNELEQAKVRLEEIRNDEGLSEKEREMLPGALLELSKAIREEKAREREQARNAVREGSKGHGQAAKRVTQSESVGSKRGNAIADVYYRSLGYYEMGRLSEARDGFVKVIASGTIPPAMVRHVEGYIAAIDSRLRRKSNGGSNGNTGEIVETGDGVGNIEREKSEIIDVAEPDSVSVGEVDLRRGHYTVSGGAIDQDNSEEAKGAAGVGGYIGVVLKNRNIIRSYTKAAVVEAEQKAGVALSKGDFDEARRLIATARFTVNENEIHLGEALFAEYSGRLVAKEQEITRREGEVNRLTEEKAQEDAIRAAKKLREQMDADREARIAELMNSARSFAIEGQYEAALGQLEELLAIDPIDDEALTLKDALDDMLYFRKERVIKKRADRERAESLLDAVRSGIPYAEEVTYPTNWAEIVAKETRKPDAPIGLDPADREIYSQLDEVVDLSALTPTMPLSAAIDEIKNAVDPPLKMVVIWRDLYDNANVDAQTEINMDGLSEVRLGTGLDNLLKAVTGGLGEDIGYIVEDGVITIATTLSLPSKLETRVYDIADLVGQQANFQQAGMMNFGGGGGYGNNRYGSGGGYGSSGYGSSGYGGGGYGGGSQGAYDLVYLIMETIEPDSWFEMSDIGEGTITLYPGASSLTGGSNYGGGTSGRSGRSGGYGGYSGGGYGGYGGGGYGGGGRYGGYGGGGSQPKKMVVQQTREIHNKIEKLLAELRKSLGHQVSIEARYLVVSENFLEDIGLDLDFGYMGGPPQGIWTYDQSSSLMTQPDVSTKVPGSLGGVGDALLVQGGYTGFILNDLQVSFLLRATQAHTDAKTLTAPKVTVLSGESASFSVQNDVSYALPPDQTFGSSAGTFTGGGVQTSSIEQNIDSIQVGSSLTISPIITNDKKNVLLYVITQLQDLLRMKSHSVEGPVGQDGTVQQYTITVPETETSQVMTRVSVPDGGTLLLGGQKITAEIEKEAGVPILSKVPVLGRLFSNRSRIRDHKILLILVKPTIILQEEREAEALAAMSNKY